MYNSTAQHFPKIQKMVIHVYHAYDIHIDIKDGGYFCRGYMLYPTRKAWFTRHDTRARVEIDVFNYVTKCGTKIKTKVF